MTSDPEFTDPRPDHEVPPVVHSGPDLSPEDRIELDAKEARQQRRVLVLGLVLMVVSAGLMFWAVVRSR